MRQRRIERLFVMSRRFQEIQARVQRELADAKAMLKGLPDPSRAHIIKWLLKFNDNSVAFVLQYRSFRMLFTGDAGVEAEQRFLREGIDLGSAVLKVGHHGSAYSSSQEFIAAVHPRYALISVGRHNLFGHPAPSTIRRLDDDGIRVDRTDENAAVIVETDGASSSVRSLYP